MSLDHWPNRRSVGAVLAIALALQILDTSTLRRMLREAYQPQPPLALNMDALRDARSLRFVPAYSCSDAHHAQARQIALGAERNGALVEDGPIGRFDPAICALPMIERELSNTQPQQKNMLTLKSLPLDITERARRSGRCTALGENLLCGNLGG